MPSSYSYHVLIDKATSGANDAADLRRDFLLLADIIRERFPSHSPLSDAIGSLNERIGKTVVEDVPTEGGPATADLKERNSLRRELNAIGAAAKQLIDIAPESLLEVLKRNFDGEQQEVVRMVNDAFFRSTLFSSAKYILAVSLLLLGIGSLGYAGMNFYVWDKMQVAQQRLSAATQGFNDTIKQIDLDRAQLKSAQETARKEVDDAVQIQSGKIQQDFAVEIMNAKNWLTAQLGNVTTFIGSRKDDLNRDVESAIQEMRAKAMSFGKDQMSIIATAAKNGTGEIEAKSADVVEALGREADRKISDIDASSANNIAVLDKTLNARLTDINGEATRAQTRIDAIVSRVDAHATQFDSDMDGRLTAWDKRMTTEQGKLDGLVKSMDGLQRDLSDSTRQMAALQQSSKSALEIAGKLSSGTMSNQLALIGAVLERSSLLIVISLVLAVASLATSIWASRSSRTP